MTQELIDARENTKHRLRLEYDCIAREGKPVTYGITKELDILTALRMQIQLDVLSQDPANDDAGYTLIDASGELHQGVSKVAFEETMLELKQLGFALWSEFQTLCAQADTCETQEQLNALTFSE